LRITQFDDLVLAAAATFFAVGLFELISVVVCDRAFMAIGWSAETTQLAT